MEIYFELYETKNIIIRASEQSLSQNLVVKDYLLLAYNVLNIFSMLLAILSTTLEKPKKPCSVNSKADSPFSFKASLIKISWE
jgi:hypothetical protein